MATIHGASRLAATALALGIAGQLLFFDVGLGINFPIAIAALVISGWLLRRPAVRPTLRDAWLGPVAVLFAVFTAIRADTTIVLLDLLTAIGLAGAALTTFGGRVVLARPFARLVALGVGAIGWMAGGAAKVVSAAGRAMPREALGLRRASPALPVIRGLLLAIPVVLVFVGLFSAADAIFARFVDNLFSFDLNADEVIGRLLLALLLAWFAAGALGLAAAAPSEKPMPADGPSFRWRLGRTEALTVLVVMNALFIGFVALQGTYLFGGLDTLEAIGMTYSDYARRGFFELATAAVLAGGLIVALERLVGVRSRSLVGLSIGLAVLTAVVLVSAVVRMWLYQAAYGWTELRLYVLATIVWLGMVLVALVGALLADRVRWIGHAALAAGLAIGLGLNVLGPVRFITEQNVARVLNPTLVPDHGSSGLDASYVASLGDDAIPELVRILPALDGVEAAYLREELEERLRILESSPSLSAWQAWNAGREAARSALVSADVSDQLED